MNKHKFLRKWPFVFAVISLLMVLTTEAQEDLSKILPPEALPVPNNEFGVGGQPELCNPENPVLTRVSDFSIEDTQSGFIPGGVSFFADYVNAFGQVFRLMAHSQDATAARTYLEELIVCFEAIEVGPASETDADSDQLDASLDEELPDTNDFPIALARSPQDILVEMDWLNPPQQGVERYTIFFVNDPWIGFRQRHYYSWTKRTYVEAWICVTSGRVSLYLWRWAGFPWALRGTTNSALDPQCSTTLWKSSSTSQWYRVSTYGRDSSNFYNMYGSWRYSSFYP